jgi:hypothetical protein
MASVGSIRTASIEALNVSKRTTSRSRGGREQSRGTLPPLITSLGNATIAELQESRPSIQRACCSSCAAGRGCEGEVLHRDAKEAGAPLDAPTRTKAESAFGADFRGVRVHRDASAEHASQALGARAFTIGRDIYFGSGMYSPDSAAGFKLLAHELTHTLQQGGGQTGPMPATLEVSEPADASEQEAETISEHFSSGAAVSVGSRIQSLSTPSVQRAQTVGTRVTQPTGAKSPYRAVTAAFDGENFTLFGDGKQILTASGQSGRPNTVQAADAKACGGAPTDSYLNNPRYVGIKDNGAIPEGQYTFLRSDMVTFTTSEQAKVSLAGESEYVDPGGLPVHGDWGAARAALHPVTLAPSKFCGSTSGRSGFYLHGGVMPGSSGCIDIGNAAIQKVVDLLAGYTGPVRLTVKYTTVAPDVGPLDRALGRFMYPPKKDPGITDRLKSLLDF